MNYISIYIRRTFSKNFKKQFFLILGIAAFMVMLVVRVMGKDSEERKRVAEAERSDWGFNVKISDVSVEGIDYLNGHEEVVHAEPVRKIEITGGIDHAEYLISSEVPDAWEFTYLYGEAPGRGEVLLTEKALISKRQPIPGETILLEVKVGEEKKQIRAVVSGVVKALGSFTEAYVFLYGDNFRELTEELPYEESKYDVFVQTANFEDGKLAWDFHEQFGACTIVGMSREGEVYEGYSLKTVFYQIMVVMILFGACLGAIIYIVLQDEKKNIGILRALGAKKKQIAAMLTARILMSGIIGILLGSGITLLVREIEKVLTYTDTGIGKNTGWVSIVIIPAGGLAVLLLLQLPAIFALLKETPVALMNGVGRIGESLISLKSKQKLRIKHPIWWYAGLEGKRLRGKRFGLILITITGLLFPTIDFLMLQSSLKRDEQNAFEETYTVEKRDMPFTEEEVIRILEVPGLQSAGFSVEQSGSNIAEYEGKPVTVRLQVLDEQNFRKMKINSEKAGMIVPAESGKELLGENGILVRKTARTANRRMEKGETIQLLSPSGTHYDCEIVMMAQNMGEIDTDYYMFISFHRYCEIFGVPEIRSFSVMLDNTTYAEAVSVLEREAEGVSLTRNELLYGNTQEELKHDTWISTMMEVLLAVLAAVVFLFCYYSFYYLAKTEEYRKLFAMGASKRMVKRAMLLQSVRSAWILALVNAGLGYLLYRFNISTFSDQWLKGNTVQLPVAELMVLILFVIGISLGATWFASGQVLKELEQKE